MPPAFDFEHDFIILIGEGGDDPVDDGGAGDGHTNPETPGAVAVDADGDYVVVWTALNTAAGLDQAYLRRYYATGVPKAALVGVTARRSGVRRRRAEQRQRGDGRRRRLHRHVDQLPRRGRRGGQRPRAGRHLREAIRLRRRRRPATPSA